MNLHLAGGFEFLIERLVRGVVVEREIVHNLMPTEGLDHMVSVTMKNGTQVPTWYLGLYEGNYVPASTDTMALLPGLATEATTYDEAGRVVWNEGAVVTGAVNNSANKAEFTSNANKTIYGGFITSNQTKGATTGVLLSVVRFASPKTFEVGSILRVTAGFTLTSI